MFEVSVTTTFSAAHAIVIRGQREPLHGHDWNVVVTLAGPRLDEDSLLVDFHLVEGVLDDIVGPFRNANLNEVAPFDRLNPSAERVAQHIGETMAARLATKPANGANTGARAGVVGGGIGEAGRGVRVASVRVTEAPGCAATWRPALNDGRPSADVDQ